MAVYERLDPAKEELRVISISEDQGDVDDFICCTLETVSLSDWTTEYQRSQDLAADSSQPSTPGSYYAPEAQAWLEDQPRFSWGDYETLSYTWGSPDRLRTILVNNQQYQVRQNLHDALIQFRNSHRYSEMKLWVDAICINQDDDFEKAIQVKRMRHIYSTAVRTIVWLGKDLGPEFSPLVDAKAYVDQLSSILTRTVELRDPLLSEHETDSGSSGGDGSMTDSEKYGTDHSASSDEAWSHSFKTKSIYSFSSSC